MNRRPSRSPSTRTAANPAERSVVIVSPPAAIVGPWDPPPKSARRPTCAPRSMVTMRPPLRSSRRHSCSHRPRVPRCRDDRVGRVVNHDCVERRIVERQRALRTPPARRRARRRRPPPVGSALPTSSSGTTIAAVPVRPDFAAIRATQRASPPPICSTRSPSRTPLIVTASGSRANRVLRKNMRISS